MADHTAWELRMLACWLKYSGRTIHDVIAAIERHHKPSFHGLPGVPLAARDEIAAEFRPHPTNDRYVVATLDGVERCRHGDFWVAVRRGFQELSITKPWRRDLCFAVEFERRNADLPELPAP